MTFTCPCRVSMMLAGFRSRWRNPRRARSSSASAISIATRSASENGMPAARAAGDPAFLRRCTPSPRRGRPGLRRFRRSCRCTGDRSRRPPSPHGGGARARARPWPDVLRQQLDCDIAFEARVESTIDDAHSSSAERRQDLDGRVDNPPQELARCSVACAPVQANLRRFSNQPVVEIVQCGKMSRRSGVAAKADSQLLAMPVRSMPAEAEQQDLQGGPGV